jgi:hypothetical protein
MESLFPDSPLGILVLILLLAWSFAWKGVALWRSARNSHKVWFIVLLIINTVGILEIIYFFAFSKEEGESY